MYNLTKEQAMEALKQGKKLKHRLFCLDEYITKGGRGIMFEDGCSCAPYEFWQHRYSNEWKSGWMIVE